MTRVADLITRQLHDEGTEAITARITHFVCDPSGRACIVT